MRDVFIDTSYFIALVKVRDAYHRVLHRLIPLFKGDSRFRMSVESILAYHFVVVYAFFILILCLSLE